MIEFCELSTGQAPLSSYESCYALYFWPKYPSLLTHLGPWVVSIGILHGDCTSAYTNFPFGQRAVVFGSPRRLGHGRTPLRILDEIIISSPFEMPTKNQPIFCHQLYDRQSRLHIERRGFTREWQMLLCANLGGFYTISRSSKVWAAAE